MLKTLRISFALKNTYRVNGILHSLKQIPLLKRVLPDRLYQVRGLKIFANILSVLWEIVSIFLGKLLYFLTMVCGVGLLYEQAPAGLGFLHCSRELHHIVVLLHQVNQLIIVNDQV